MCGEKYWKLHTVLSYRGVVYLLYMLYFKTPNVCIVLDVLCVLLLVVLCVLLLVVLCVTL